jgi:hypothetical protein
MTIVRFLYKRVRGIYQPVIPLGIKFPNQWVPLDVCDLQEKMALEAKIYFTSRSTLKGMVSKLRISSRS